MELIPVFAFIVLVATIATFIFALAAYILFKVRERRGKYAARPHHNKFKAELVTPNYYYLPNNEDTNQIMNSNPESISEDLSFYQNEEEVQSVNKSNGNELIWK